MKFVSWNVNSIRARHDRLFAFLERHDPDVVALQENKVTYDDFPTLALRAAGYLSVCVGQKSYNGVAILSKREPTEVVTAFCDGVDDSQSRFVAATIEGVRFLSVYVPNGQRVGSEKYDFKLEWMARLASFVAKDSDPERPLIVAGDYNVAPDDIDVHDPAVWRDEIMCSEPERQALRRLTDWGLSDAFRHVHPERAAFSWWDYRRLAFPKGRGLRIDHLLVTRPLLSRLREVEIDREERKGKLPSDHAPVLAVVE